MKKNSVMVNNILHSYFGTTSSHIETIYFDLYNFQHFTVTVGHFEKRLVLQYVDSLFKNAIILQINV